MANPPPEPDATATLTSFLLHAYISMLADPRRTAEEQLQLRIALEDVILRHGIRMLRQVQRAFNIVPDELIERSALAHWFVEFAASLEQDWLHEVPLSTIELFWRILPDPRFRR